MPSGRKRKTPEELAVSKTFRPRRHAPITVVDAGILPQMPGWLTPFGEEVWMENIGRVSSIHGISELDTDLFGNYCNLQGAIAAAWAGGEVPNSRTLAEARKMQESLRIGGASSRITKVNNSMKAAGVVDGNPFMRQLGGRQRIQEG